MPDPTQDAFERYPELRQMFDEVRKFRPEIRPSGYWEKLIRRNLRYLGESGYENFKRTVARTCFMWIVNPFNDQVRFLAREAGLPASLRMLLQALATPRHAFFKKKHTIYYNLLTRLLWDYVEKNDTEGLLQRLTEPDEGNPPGVFLGGRLISQDLANAVLEYRNILHPAIDRQSLRTILEIGPGYGRTAYVFLALQPGCRYILVDIPPVLYVAQRYLTTVFPDRRVFAFRPFGNYDAVREEMADASIIFLTPNQLGLLPDQSADLSINISSLHEMRMDQIRYYFAEIARLTRRYFYFKQWKETTVPFENEVIRESDYPVPGDWKRIYRQQCEVQHRFFEALYELPSESEAQ